MEPMNRNEATDRKGEQSVPWMFHPAIYVLLWTAGVSATGATLVILK